MTRIEFFFNVPDKVHHAVTLSEKAVARGRRLMVYVADRQMAQAVGQAMWTQSQASFLPHCASAHPLAAATPVIVDWQPADPLPHHDVLINLQHEQPIFFSRFTRLIEIVGPDEADKAQARARYRFYRDRGYELRAFDASGAAL